MPKNQKKSILSIMVVSLSLLGGCATVDPKAQEDLIRKHAQEVALKFESQKVSVNYVDGYDVCNERPMKTTLKLSADALCGKKEDCLREYDNPKKGTEIIVRKSDASRLFGLAGAVLFAATGDVSGAVTNTAQEVIPSGERKSLAACAQKTFISLKTEDGEDIYFFYKTPWFDEVPYKSINDFSEKEQFVFALITSQIDVKRFMNEKYAYLITAQTGRGEKIYIVTPEEFNVLNEYKSQVISQGVK